MSGLRPRVEVLPPAQREVWPELGSVPSHFVLYGGTAVALRLGHRSSVDFDFFSDQPLDHGALRAAATFLSGAAVLQEEKDALTVSVERGGPVKVSFFGNIAFGRISDPDETEDHVLRVASLLDLGATKVKVLLQRVEAKDYLDVAALIRAGVSLSDMLSGASTLFGAEFNPLSAQKALGYFEGGNFSAVDPASRELLVRESARSIKLQTIPRRASTLA